MFDVKSTMLSVIIPTINEAENIQSLLSALQHQKEIFFEVIIADGGSSDDTLPISSQYNAKVITSSAGRGWQMNRGAESATGNLLLFLHADSVINDNYLLANAVAAIMKECNNRGNDTVAGHFSLKFIRSRSQNRMMYSFLETKSRLNLDHTTNGDQGLLISARFFREIGGFDERLPYLEDQRIGTKIRERGEMVTLPGYIGTSARRFESEGFWRRYILMGIMLAMEAIKEERFFSNLKGIYRIQNNTGKLLLEPVRKEILNIFFKDWNLRGLILKSRGIGAFVLSNIWQFFLFPTLFSGSCNQKESKIRCQFAESDVKSIFALLTGFFVVFLYLFVILPIFELSERRIR